MKTTKRGPGRPKMHPKDRQSIVGVRLHLSTIGLLARKASKQNLSTGKFVKQTLEAEAVR